MDRFHPADDRLIAVYFGDEEASEGDGEPCGSTSTDARRARGDTPS